MDEYGIKPNALSIEVEQEEQEAILDRQDIDIADSYFHPSWIEVEKIFISEIEQLTLKPNPNLLADEYKINSLADEKARNTLIAILERIKNAVSAVESNKSVKPVKQRK